VLEELLAAEVLVIGVLDPPLAQHFVQQVVGVLEDRSPAINRVGSGGRPGSSVQTSPNRSSRKLQSTVRLSATSGCLMSMIWSSRERKRACSPVSFRSRGRISSPRQSSQRRVNHKSSLQGIPLKDPTLSGKSNHRKMPFPDSKSTAWKFFTGDYTLWPREKLTP
jgi:hypothetical protein